MSVTRNLKKGEILFREGDPSEAMYVVKSGRIAITKAKGESDVTLAELGPGDLLGEMAFFDEKPRSATASVLQDTVVIELPFRALNTQLASFPEWLKAIMKAVNVHLRNANTRIKQLERSEEEETQFFPSHLITRLISILAFVAHRFGEKDGSGWISVPPGTLRRYTIQIFQQPTNKMQKLTEILAALGHVKIEDLGEGRQKLLVKDVAQLFDLVDFYNEYLFTEESKRTPVEERELRPLHGLIFYGERSKDTDTKGRKKINLTLVQQDSMRDLGYVLGPDDFNSLISKGLVSDKLSENGFVSVWIDLTNLKRIHPIWEIIHSLKRIQAR